jgi:hypothetical protein
MANADKPEEERKMVNWGAEIANATKDALSAMPNDELAYLALTTKSEGPMRDRIAFHLHKTHKESEFWVAREWKRIDLAFIGRSDREPICLVELKAIYTVDPLLKGCPVVREGGKERF